MKISYALVLFLAVAAPAVAGTSAKEVIAPAAPSLWSWFAGASIGHLDDFDETMYHGHVGVDTPWKVGGWDVALFAELGQAEANAGGIAPIDAPPLNILNALAPVRTQELEIMPLTLNVKLERPIAGKLSASIGAGLGVAFVDFSSRDGLFPSVNDEALAAQAFAGLVYNLCASAEIFGGARWIYVDYDAAGFGAPSFDDDILYEAGLRYNF
jgi:hypothetical protein